MQNTTMNMNDIQQVEVSIETAKERIKLQTALNRLIKNKDFKLIVDTGYFDNESIRLVHLKSDFEMREADKQEFVCRAIDAVGMFRAYLSRIYQQGTAAQNALNSHEQTLAELLAEEESEDGLVN
jgi:hypothetical protein